MNVHERALHVARNAEVRGVEGETKKVAAKINTVSNCERLYKQVYIIIIA